MNLRPPGYEPGELPDCSTPQCLGASCAQERILRVAIHDTVHEMAKDEARHGRGFEGLLKRYFNTEV